MDQYTEQEKYRIMRDFMASVKQAKEQGDEARQYYNQEVLNSLNNDND